MQMCHPFVNGSFNIHILYTDPRQGSILCESTLVSVYVCLQKGEGVLCVPCVCPPARYSASCVHSDQTHLPSATLGSLKKEEWRFLKNYQRQEWQL
jgi:hypothetical protein